ncbi:inovirus Gp2 family protein [bacterium 19CA06SA08-2]|uniref:Inovirus Gp2 family protein n=1 Tax=bacterium 19CA06SA08-2 TaxID=2920658 RepID=A0AAU6U9P5_UNCXX
MKRVFPYGEIYSLPEPMRMFINSIASSGRQALGMLTSLDEIIQYNPQREGIHLLSTEERKAIFNRKTILLSHVDDFKFIGRCIRLLSLLSTVKNDKDYLDKKINLKRRIKSISDELLYMQSKFKTYCMHPHIELFLNHISDKAIHDAICNSGNENGDKSEHAIMHLISKLQDKKHLMKVHSFECNAEENYKSYLKYCKALLADFKKIWIFKLDVHLNDDCFSHADFDRLTSFKDSLFKDKRKFDFFDDLVGHIWRLEYSPFTGYFYHFIFIFDMRNKEPSELMVVESKIIKCWNNRISKQEGHCKKIPVTKNDVYVTIGIGKRQLDICEDTIEIEKMISYLTKRDGFAKIKHPESAINSKRKMRLIGKGKNGKPKRKKYGWIKE